MTQKDLLETLKLCDWQLLRTQLSALIDVIDSEKQSANLNREKRADILTGLEEFISQLLRAHYGAKE